jgi:hypothetical protein
MCINDPLTKRALPAIAIALIGLAIEEIKKMLRWRLSDREWQETDADYLRDPAVRA